MNRIFLLLFFIPAAGFVTAADRPAKPFEKNNPSSGYNVSKERTYSGNVVFMSKEPLAGNGNDKSDFVFVMIKTAKGEKINCAVAPNWYLRGSLKFNVNEYLVIKGFSSDSKTVLVRVIQSGKETLAFRDPNGSPLWDNGSGGTDASGGDGGRGPGNGKGPGGGGMGPGGQR
jgi:hypothetical protein